MNLLNKNKTKTLTNWSSIQMVADKTIELNISGFIGVPEWWQFDPDMEKDLISTKEKMQKELKEISNLKAETIKVNIDSLGGDVNHGQAIYSALAKNPANIEVEYTGWSASIATIIAAAATDNEISMSHTNMILIHKARGGAYGVSSAMSRYAIWLDKIDTTMSEIYANQTGNSKEEMFEVMSQNDGESEWLTASEAKEIGLIKNIIEPMKAAANYDTNRLKEFGYKIPQNKLNSINMKFKFGKDEPIINTTVDKDGKILLHEGELKVDSTVQLSGAEKAEGDYPLEDGRTIKVNAENVVTEISEPAAATDDNDVVTQVAAILVDLEARIDAKIEALKKTGSTTKIAKVDSTQTTQVVESTQATASKGVQARMKELQDNKREKQGLN